MSSLGYVVLQSGPASDPATSQYVGIGILLTIGILFLLLGLGRVLSWVGL